MKPLKATREQLRRHNQQMLLRTIYYGLADNRAALAQETGLAKPTVSDLIAELIDEGLLIESGRGESTEGGGKRPTLIKFVPEARQIIGISMEANQGFGVLSNLNGQVLAQHTADFNTVQGENAVALLKEVINGLLAQLDAPLLCIGVGVSGLVDSETGIVRQSDHFGWADLPLQAILTREYGVPVYVGNTTELTAIAQFAFGIERDDEARNLVTVRVSRSVEVGVAWGDAAYHHGGSIDSLSLRDGDTRRPIETLLSWEAVQQRVLDLRAAFPDSLLPLHDVSYLHVRYAAANGDSAAAQLIDELTELLAQVMAWIIALLRPNHISLAGSIVNLGRPFLDGVAARTEAYLSPKLVGAVTFSLAYSANLSAIGAVAHALQMELDVI